MRSWVLQMVQSTYTDVASLRLYPRCALLDLFFLDCGYSISSDEHMKAGINRTTFGCLLLPKFRAYNINRLGAFLFGQRREGCASIERPNMLSIKTSRATLKACPFSG